MILIIEGQEGPVKDAVVRALHQALSADDDTTVSRCGQLSNVAPADAAQLFFREMLPAITYNKHVLMLGSWLSDGNRELITPTHRRMLERSALSRNALVIVVGAEPWVDNYDAIPLVVYEPPMTLRQLMEDVTHDLELDNPYLGGGMWSPGGILMLCSKWGAKNVKPGAAVIPYVNFKVFGGGHRSPSEVVAGALEESGLPECEFYWANTELTDGEELSPTIVDELQPRAIVAIGHVPQSWCQRHGIEAAFVNQPNRADTFSLAEVLKSFGE